MGRPIQSKYFGESITNEDMKFIVSAKIGINKVDTECFIVKQRGTFKFVVQDNAGNKGTCSLVNKKVPDDDEMVLSGIVYDDNCVVNIRKLHNKTMFDYENNRYTWEIQNDSAENELVLFKI